MHKPKYLPIGNDVFLRGVEYFKVIGRRPNGMPIYRQIAEREAIEISCHDKPVVRQSYIENRRMWGTAMLNLATREASRCLFNSAA